MLNFKMAYFEKYNYLNIWLGNYCVTLSKMDDMVHMTYFDDKNQIIKPITLKYNENNIKFLMYSHPKCSLMTNVTYNIYLFLYISKDVIIKDVSYLVINKLLCII